MAVAPHTEDELTRESTKRSRWATQRVKGRAAGHKRVSIMDRFHKGQNEKKRDSAGAESMTTDLEGNHAGTEGSDDGTDNGREPGEARKVFFNIPLPPEALDDNGRPAAHFNRNKIRTAKYTPISFVPKNLWYQFHNIANVYFLFLIILAVSNLLSDICVVAMS
jgi:phospholipid-translocating ATPase